ncbi:basic blue protein-like [Forsythia ovata]|uniref:Basic blue protein-like n=1 Tax=Forsythia ovata TaxID=205694 RepID=A0ABD1WYL3_9LAMI
MIIKSNEKFKYLTNFSSYSFVPPVQQNEFKEPIGVNIPVYDRFSSCSVKRGNFVFHREEAVQLLATAVMKCLVVLFNYEVAEAATYTVGGAGGWTFDVADWPKGKNFKVGDILAKTSSGGKSGFFLYQWTEYEPPLEWGRR